MHWSYYSVALSHWHVVSILMCYDTWYSSSTFHPYLSASLHWLWGNHMNDNLTIIGSDNGLSPDRCQAIIWINAGILLTEPLGTNFNEFLIKPLTFSFKEMHLKMSSENYQPFCHGLNVLTHWGRVMHICVSNLTIIGPDNGLSPGRRQAIIWTNALILLIGPLGTNFSEILIEIQTFSFKKMRLKVSSAKWRPFCLGLNVLNYHHNQTEHNKTVCTL